MANCDNISHSIRDGTDPRTLTQRGKEASSWSGRDWKKATTREKEPEKAGRLFRGHCANEDFLYQSRKVSKSDWNDIKYSVKRGYGKENGSTGDRKAGWVNGCRSSSKKIVNGRATVSLIEYNKQINQAAKNGDVKTCEAVLAEISRAGWSPDAFSFAPIINIHVRNRDEQGAYAVVDAMKTSGVHPDRVIFTSLINLFVRKEDVEGAYAVFDEMKRSNIRPNEVSHRIQALCPVIPLARQ